MDMRRSLSVLVRAAFLGLLLLGVAPLVAPVAAHAQQPATPTTPASQAKPQPPRQRPPQSQDEFVPVTDLPESEKLPAAPYLIAAYTIVWLLILGYVWSLWRRLSLVEQELKRAVQSARE